MTHDSVARSGTRPALLRPTLIPGLRRLWRSPHALQLGVDPARAVVLELTDPAAAHLLDLLDGAHTERMVLAHAARHGVPEGSGRALLSSLHRAGLVLGAQSLLPVYLAPPTRRRLVPEAAALALARMVGAGVRRWTGATAPPGGPTATPAQVLRHRMAARVVVTGRGRLAALIAIALAHAGIGHLSPLLDGVVQPGDTLAGGLLDTDLGRPSAEAVAEAIARSAPGTDTRRIRRGRVSFLVQVGAAGPAELRATVYAQRRLAHLAVNVRDGVVVVGPLVPSAGSPCLHCLDLHRQDRDPDWPALAAQLATTPADQATAAGAAGAATLAPGDEPCAAPTVLAAAGFAAAEVLAHIDGRLAHGRRVAGAIGDPPYTLGATVEIAAPGRQRRRTWPPHPDCGCARRPRRPA